MRIFSGKKRGVGKRKRKTRKMKELFMTSEPSKAWPTDYPIYILFPTLSLIAWYLVLTTIPSCLSDDKWRWIGLLGVVKSFPPHFPVFNQDFLIWHFQNIAFGALFRCWGDNKLISKVIWAFVHSIYILSAGAQLSTLQPQIYISSIEFHWRIKDVWMARSLIQES